MKITDISKIDPEYRVLNIGKYNGYVYICPYCHPERVEFHIRDIVGFGTDNQGSDHWHPQQKTPPGSRFAPWLVHRFGYHPGRFGRFISEKQGRSRLFKPGSDGSIAVCYSGDPDVG